MAVFTVKDLKFAYPGGNSAINCVNEINCINAINCINLEITQGEFIVLCGRSGCGKTTLLRHFKSVLTPEGKRSGAVYFDGKELEAVPQNEQAAKIGYVLQSPEDQIVTDKVWHEMAFGLESLGVAPAAMRLRVGEMAAFFGIEAWFRKSVDELSGGQKQVLNLASVMVTQPSVLVLDEPTAQLDPISAAEFLSAVHKINRELGVTVIISEHRLEELFPMADRVLVMENGQVIMDGAPGSVGRRLCDMPGDVFLSAPSPMRIHAKSGADGESPLTVRDGRRWLDRVCTDMPSPHTDERERAGVTRKGRSKEKPLAELSGCWFRYERNAPDVIRDLSVSIYPGTVFAVVGGNGAGKSTALGLLAGLRVPYRGHVRFDGVDIRRRGHAGAVPEGVSLLPQNPQTLFAHTTVYEELLEMGTEEEARRMAERLELEPLLDRHPYDLSGGEQQRTAIAKTLMTSPRLLLLDEPTKGIDPEFKPKLAAIFEELAAEGTAVVMVSHDIEFCAGAAGRCALFFDGGIIADADARDFFAGNEFYTTAANRMARHIAPSAVTDYDVIGLVKGDKL